jgi:Outer membrane cobalamin receptor protein
MNDIIKWFLLFVLTMTLPFTALANRDDNRKFNIEGRVISKIKREPLSNVQLSIRELIYGTFLIVDGLFKFESISQGEYTIDIITLGYSSETISLNIIKNITDIVVEMNEENLTIDEVVVTAETGKSINTSSVIGTTAIRHLQPSSLTDIMQLLPGSVTANPTLTSKNDITLRSVIDPGNNNARGVALLVNGVRVSNEASIFLETPADLFNTMDFRKYSTDNIETVEVLKGILSAEYGDVSAGAVLVKTKAGRTPFEVRIKADPRTKAISFSKGFYMGNRIGSLNIDADYAMAFKDPRSPVDVYSRTTMGITYSNTFSRGLYPLRFNARLSGYLIENNSMVDPDVSKRDFKKRREGDISLAIYGNWL